MRFDDIVPVNNFIARTELRAPSFDFSEEPFNFPVGLGVFHTCDDVFDLMMIEKIFEFVLSMFPVSG